MGFPEISHRNLTVGAGATSSLGFSLLPSELIHQIMAKLSLHDIACLKLTNKLINSLTKEKCFVREYNTRSSSSTWLFVHRKPWHRNSILHGFPDHVDNCDRATWFKFRIDNLLYSKFDDAYFLVAGGNIFLFALNSTRDVISVNPISMTTKRLPPIPSGSRDTSRWRRSGMKLLPGPPGSGHFKFVFTDLIDDHPVLFSYNSITDSWKSTEARESVINIDGSNGVGYDVVLSVVHRGSENIKIAYDGESEDHAVILRPRFHIEDGDDQDHLLRVYGDGNMMIVGWESGSGSGVRMVKSVELKGLSLDGRRWEKKSMVPSELIEKIRRPYNVIMGFLEETRNDKIRAVLVSSYEGQIDITWLNYHIDKMIWSSIPLPDSHIKGSNLAGIAFSSALTLPL